MPTITTDEQGREITVYSAEEQAEGLTKARLLDSAERVRFGQSPWASDAAYAAHVAAAVGLAELPEHALHSYCEQFAGRTVASLQADLDAALAGLPPEPFPVDPPAPEPADPVAVFTAALERWYDRVAQARRYDNRYTCALRAGYAGPFQAEGAAFAAWMDTCNAHAYGVMAAVQAGQRAMPESPAALVAELPTPPWVVE